MYTRVQKIKRKDGRLDEYIQILESYREGNRVRQKTIANLGNKSILQGQLPSLLKILNPSLLQDEEKVKPINAASYGGTYLVHQLFAELGLWNLLDRCSRSRGFADRIAILVANRLYSPCSEHRLASWLETVYACDRSGERILPVWKQRGRVKVDLKWLNPFYRSLDGLIANKVRIEKHIYEKLKDLFHLNVETVFYDLTSTYFEGEGPSGLSQYGHSRDGHPQNRQVLVGVVMVNGFPLSHHVFSGGLKDHETVEYVVNQVSKNFDIGRMVWVGARGMMTTTVQSFLQEKKQGYLLGLVRRRRPDIIEYIEAIRGSGTECKIGITQTEKNPSPKTWAWEVKGKEEGVRVFVVHSEEREVYEVSMRQRSMEKVRLELEGLKKEVAVGKLKKREKIGFHAGKILSRHKGYRYYDWKISEDGKFEYFEHPINLPREKKIEGKYLIQTEEQNFDVVEAVFKYKELSEVERGFRSMKDVINMRPVFHQTSHRVEAHIFVATLSLLLERIIERKLKAEKSFLSAFDALRALETIGVVEFNINGKIKKGVTAGSDRARQALKALYINKILLPRKIQLKR